MTPDRRDVGLLLVAILFVAGLLWLAYATRQTPPVDTSPSAQPAVDPTRGFDTSASRGSARTTPPTPPPVAAVVSSPPKPPAAESAPPSSPFPTTPVVGKQPAAGGLPQPWADLAACESSGNPQAVNPDGPYYGLFQFLQSTWESVGGTGIPTDASVAEQLKRAQILQARSGWDQWLPCAADLGLIP